ncbi:MAG: YifB family Mg chelatase-like AAA ATPase [Actinomycetota bacterium]
MFARASSVAVVGIDGYPIDVEVQVGSGLPSFIVVGLPDTAIQESRERVRAAVLASGEQWPNQRLTVNLSPAHLPKAGSGFDLAIALALLAAVGRVPSERLDEVCAVGELSLDGAVRKIRGVLAVVGAAATKGIRRMLVPRPNAAEAALIDGVEVIPLVTLRQAISFLRGEFAIAPATPAEHPDALAEDVDIAEVRGQMTPKWALEIAAAGGHNLLMTGPPGGGKTMLARRMPSILPPLARDDAMVVTRLYSVAGMLPDESGLILCRPFRAPHHSISTAGLVGGGSGIPMPGEVSLAHRGVLFLDEAGEFRRDALEALRQPIEDGTVTISRARVTVTYPSRCQLILATNPCPCGHYGDQVRSCECAPGRITVYRQRLSGPLIDRMDLRIKVDRIGKAEIFASPTAEPSATIRARIVQAQQRQRAALAPFGVSVNADIPPRALLRACRITRGAKAALEAAQGHFGMTMRATHRAIRVARTIADLTGSGDLTAGHVNEALSFRQEQ